VVPPIRDARFVDLILAVFMSNSGQARQERVCRAQRPAAKIDAIATSAGDRDRTPRIWTRGNARKLRAIRQRPGNIGSHRTAWWWMQPGSNRSPHLNSLLAGNLAGNFLKKGPPRAILASKTRAASTAYNQIPCSTEQGIFLHEQGILSREQGILRGSGKRPFLARLFCACRTRSVLTGLFAK
jgi:hypothetical protein